MNFKGILVAIFTAVVIILLFPLLTDGVRSVTECEECEECESIPNVWIVDAFSEGIDFETQVFESGLSYIYVVLSEHAIDSTDDLSSYINTLLIDTDNQTGAMTVNGVNCNGGDIPITQNDFIVLTIAPI